ncbi:hypothetical protein [Streptomyces sp. NBC_01190]|uniref:hypothetical protein n=1 Tax=Streptomyces sp. NBC_01190 TaxID=2903767 RepID=UPI00386EE475|nr:hypothetical protein OG519_17445 [Streptomyces sp. NBC_01190]
MRHGHPFSEVSHRPSERNGGSAPRAKDRRWTGRLRTALLSSGIMLTLTLVLDGLAGSLTWPRAALWTALSGLLLAVLLPPRTSAGDGWLAVRGLFRKRRVRTDLLVTLRLDGAIDRRLYLRDALGSCAQVDPRALAANPFLWHELDRGARRSRSAGLLHDTRGLRVLTDEIDTAEARALLKSADLR